MTNWLWKQIHLVNKAEDLGLWREVTEGLETVLELRHVVPLEVLARHVKDVDEHLHVLEDVLSLAVEDLLHEEILATAIPESQNQIAEESHSRLRHVDGEGNSVGVTSQVVSENDGPHRGLACMGLAHQQNFLNLLLITSRVCTFLWLNCVFILHIII